VPGDWELGLGNWGLEIRDWSLLVSTQATSCTLGKKIFNHEGHEDHEE
jgi:hypothetical protein